MYSSILNVIILHLWVDIGLAATAPQVVLPAVLGRYHVNLNHAELVDYSRKDPYAPTSQPRKLMVSVFAPFLANTSCDTATVAYMPAEVARHEDEAFASAGVPNGTFSRFRLPVCTSTSTHLLDEHCKTQFPLVMFSPGLGNSRLLYSGIAEVIASAGFAVVTIDHTFDADIVEFPDGSIVIGTVNDTTEVEIEQALAVRVADSRFVLDHVVSSPSSLGLSPVAFDLQKPRVGYFGHSLGGATAAQTIFADDRFVGGVNMDGTLHGSVVERGLDRPFLLFAREGHTLSSDSSWAQFWHESRGWKSLLAVLNTTHGTFEDLPLLAKIAGLTQASPPGALDPLLGSIDGQRALFIIYSYISAFFKQVLTGTHSKLLDGPSSRFPEVVFQN